TAKRPGSLFLFFSLVLFAVASSSFKEFSHDAWWHLAAGDWILQHHAVPRADTFSSTARGESWLDHEWGFQALSALVHRAFGIPGFVAIRVAAAVVLAVLLCAVLLARRASPPVAAVLAALAIEAARVRLQVRPELATLLFGTLLVALLTERESRRLLAV